MSLRKLTVTSLWLKEHLMSICQKLKHTHYTLLSIENSQLNSLTVVGLFINFMMMITQNE
jgi:hypothetical protein